ncbi:MAG: hypothetical protein KGO94_01540 [Alphaproteobacteria bacterium]|nr:hypothetical protein [Alphaproteobacteria bacterium]
MRAKLAEFGSDLPFRYAFPFVVLIFGIGYYGFSLECPVEKACSGETPAFAVLNNALRTFSLFFSMPEPGGEGIRNWWLMSARWIAPCITLFGLFRLFAGQFDAWWSDRQLRSLSCHHIDIGGGVGAHAENKVAINAPDAVADFHLTDEALGQATLEKANVSRASTITIKAKSDEKSLEYLEAVLKAMHGRKSEVRVALHLQNATMAAALNRNDAFCNPAEMVEVVALNADQLAAENLLRENALCADAALRGLSCVHLVIVGWSGFSLALIERFVGISPYLGLGKPRISLCCHHVGQARNAIEHHFPVLLTDQLVDLHFTELPLGQDVPSDKQMLAFEKAHEISALVIGLREFASACVAAMLLRRKCQILSVGFAPVFVVQTAQSNANHLFASSLAHDPATQIIAVDDAAHEISARTEILARAFHQAYRLDAKSAHSAAAAAIKPWAKLQQTYKNANRAAATRAISKIQASGYHVLPGAMAPHGDWAALEDNKTFEALAEMEHAGWMADRLMDGWRFGRTRNNVKLIHPDLVSYAKLPESVKELDRAQIRELKVKLAVGSGPRTLLPDYCIGVLGSSSAHLQNLIADRPHHFITLATALVEADQLSVVADAVTVLMQNKRRFRVLILVEAGSHVELAPQALALLGGSAKFVYLPATKSAIVSWCTSHCDAQI